MKLRIAPISLFVISSLSLAVLGSGTALAQQATEQVLYSFPGGAGGFDPQDRGALVMDASGNLYGTTFDGGADGYGTVFELVNSSGTYSETVLYSFTGSGEDGKYPGAALIMDASGNLYGTTYGGGGTSNVGTVFELVNSSGTYTEKVLLDFSSQYAGFGENPSAGLVMDASGNLYGVTEKGGLNSPESYGTAYELINSSGSYPNEYLLYQFRSSAGTFPLSQLIVDASGNLYGTAQEGGTDNYGTVFELINSSGSTCTSDCTYTINVLYSFTGSGGDGANPEAGLITDSSGNLYGTTAAGGTNNVGTVFELVNSSGSYSEKVLYSFTGTEGDGSEPAAGLMMDASGNLYGTTFGGGGTNNVGTVFELVNSSGSYNEKVLHSFTGTDGDGSQPAAGLIMDTSGNLYGTTANGGTGNNGIVFEIIDTSALSVSSSLNPSQYGQPVTFTATLSDAFANVKKRSPGKKAQPEILTGSVTWSPDTGCGTTSVTSGTATCTTSSLPMGGVIVTAEYSGNHNGASGSINQTVNQIATTINVTGVSPSSEVYGQDSPVVITAVLSWTGNGSAPAAAEVTINGSGNGTYGATSCGSPSSNTMTCTATYTPSPNDGVGTYVETATFSGGGTYSGSSSTQSGNFAITEASSSVAISSSQNASTYGQSITFTATINGEYGNIHHRTARNGVRPQVVTGEVTWSANTGCGTTSVTSGSPGTATCTTSSLAVGSDTVTASYSGDGDDNAGSGSVSQNVNQASATINVVGVNPPSEAYGQDAPVVITASLSWSGSGSAPTAADVIIGGNGNATYGATSCGAPSGNAMICTATYTPSISDAVGSYTETATFSGDSNYTASTSPQSGNFVITGATSAVAISSSQNPSTAGQSITFTATISGEYGAVKGRNALPRKNVVTPQVVTGSVTWSTNTGCGTTPVTSGNPGTATCTTSTLPAGSDTVTAVYGGDTNHSGSSSAVLTQTVNASSFALSATPGTATVAPGQSAALTVTITPQGSFSNPISFSCSGLPAGAACAFSPSTVTPGANTATSDLTISTTAPAASLAFPAAGHSSKSLYAIWLTLPAFLFGAVGWAKPRRRKLMSFVFVCLLAGSCLLQVACGGVSNVSRGGNGGTGGTPAGTYTIAITGTAGSTQHSTTVTLTVQ